MVFRHDPHTPPNQLYLFDDGFAFGCRSVRSETVRFNASLLIALDGGPFEVGLGTETLTVSAAVMRPMLPRRLQADDRPLLSLGISPNHPGFRPFGLLAPPGLRALDPHLFAHQAHDLAALHAGALAPAAARDAFDALIATAATVLPVPRPLDPRVARALARLDADPDVPLELLADEAGLSYDRMSHLFSDTMGLSVRSHAQSLKIHAASRLNGSGRNLTDIAHEAGFSDSSHFTRVWTRCYGSTPSYFFGNPSVRLQTLYGPRDTPRTVDPAGRGAPRG